jgi:Gluconate 2-dehydrogenase subunit 3
MKKRWTRRKFLETGLKGSVVVGAGAIGAASRSPLIPQRKDHPPQSPFSRRDRETLSAAMDEIIPASDGMPAASEAGGVEYLERVARETPGIKNSLVKILSALENSGRNPSGPGFALLPREARVEALKKFEAESPQDFAALRDLVYESYYTQPKIWKMVGYDFYPTNQSGPRMKPFDDAVLAKVRQMPKLYREVG